MAKGMGRSLLFAAVAAAGIAVGGVAAAAPTGSRLASFGFDDFRVSDLSLVEPIFAAHGATATYNRPANGATFSVNDRARMRRLEAGGNEIGDHTWRHWNVPFDDPLMNGQDPRPLRRALQPLSRHKGTFPRQLGCGEGLLRGRHLHRLQDVGEP